MYKKLSSTITLCSTYRFFAELNILKLSSVRLLLDESVTVREEEREGEGEKSGRKKEEM